MRLQKRAEKERDRKGDRKTISYEFCSCGWTVATSSRFVRRLRERTMVHADWKHAILCVGGPACFVHGFEFVLCFAVRFAFSLGVLENPKHTHSAQTHRMVFYAGWLGSVCVFCVSALNLATLTNHNLIPTQKNNNNMVLFFTTQQRKRKHKRR